MRRSTKRFSIEFYPGQMQLDNQGYKSLYINNLHVHLVPKCSFESQEFDFWGFCPEIGLMLGDSA